MFIVELHTKPGWLIRVCHGVGWRNINCLLQQQKQFINIQEAKTSHHASLIKELFSQWRMRQWNMHTAGRREIPAPLKEKLDTIKEQVKCLQAQEEKKYTRHWKNSNQWMKYLRRKWLSFKPTCRIHSTNKWREIEDHRMRSKKEGCIHPKRTHSSPTP